MKTIVFLIGIVLLTGCIGDKTTQLMTSYTKANSKDIAIDFVKHYDLYITEGKRLDCTEPVQLHGRDIWTTRCSFLISSDGSSHGADITIVNGTVKTAVLDGNIQMIAES